MNGEQREREREINSNGKKKEIKKGRKEVKKNCRDIKERQTDRQK